MSSAVALQITFFPEIKFPISLSWKDPVVEPKTLPSIDSSQPTSSLRKQVEEYMKKEFDLNISVVALFKKTGPVTAPLYSFLPFHDLIETNLNDKDVLGVLCDVHHRRASLTNRNPVKTSGKESNKIPITVLTGFLGAGKTTFLNHLLRVQVDRKIAVIENEFGEIAIDNDLLKEGAAASKISAAEQIVVMDNGCMCCTVKGDLLGAFDQIRGAISDERGEARTIDGVLIETTGMANPVPIVRTIRTTPLISSRFEMNGVVTLVDAKNALKRLKELEEEVKEELKLLGGESNDEMAKSVQQSKVEEDEAFQQIMFADKIILSKLDIVEYDVVVDVWQKIRQINENAPIVACIRGQIDPKELIDIRGYGVSSLVEVDVDEDDMFEKSDESHDHHHHDHDHDHENCEDHDHDHSHVHTEKGNCCADAQAASASNHNKFIGTFSVVHDNVQINYLKFAWWMRKLATLKREEQGTLYRSKGILEIEGSRNRLIFHAVQDVMEKQELEKTTENNNGPKSCKMVFIGKKLQKDWFEESFLSTLVPVDPVLSATSYEEATGVANNTTKEKGKGSGGWLGYLFRSSPLIFYRILSFIPRSTDVGKVGLTCKELRYSVFSDDSFSWFEKACDGHRQLAVQDRTNKLFYFHHYVSMSFLSTYAQHSRNAELDIIPYKGLQFCNADELEAAGVTWMEVCDLMESETSNYVVDFTWRPETLDKFFENPELGTNSAMVKVEKRYVDEFDDEGWDTIRFKLRFEPQKEESEDGNGTFLESYRLVIHTTGGRTSSQVYQVSLHTIHTEYQVHMKVEDHRMPMIETRETFHKYHSVLDSLRRECRVRMLIRIKPDGSGPLGDMCGCC